MKSYFKVRSTLPNYCRLRFFFSLTECVTHCQSFYADFYADFELQKSTQSDILSFKLRDPLAFIKTSTTDMGVFETLLGFKLSRVSNEAYFTSSIIPQSLIMQPYARIFPLHTPWLSFVFGFILPAYCVYHPNCWNFRS